MNKDADFSEVAGMNAIDEIHSDLERWENEGGSLDPARSEFEGQGLETELQFLHWHLQAAVVPCLADRDNG